MAALRARPFDHDGLRGLIASGLASTGPLLIGTVESQAASRATREGGSPRGHGKGAVGMRRESTEPRRDVGEPQPVVTVGLPVFNGERYLAETLDALLGQTFGDFELLISDNASADETEAICRRYVAGDRRIRYHRQAVNVGAAPNFNGTVAEARGRYFKWAAHDDLVDPRFLAEAVRALDERPEVVWCQSRVGFVGSDGQPLASGMRDGGLGMSYVEDRNADASVTRASAEPDQRFRAVLLETVGGGNWDVFGLTRTAVLRQTRLQRSFYGADKVVVAELALRGRYHEIPERLFEVRLHDDASAAIETGRDQQEWIDPAGSAPLSSARLGLLSAYVDSIHRAPLSPAQQARCYTALVAYVGQVRKWRRVLTMALSGHGTGRGLRDYHERTSASPVR